MASTSSGREKALPVRSTRGKRLAAQLEEQDAGADEEFWNQDFFAEDEVDEDYEEEKVSEDVPDSDFDEEEGDDDGDGSDTDEDVAEKKKKLKPPGYQNVKKKKAAAAPSAAAGAAAMEAAAAAAGGDGEEDDDEAGGKDGDGDGDAAAPSKTGGKRRRSPPPSLYAFDAPALRRSTVAKTAQGAVQREKVTRPRKSAKKRDDGWRPMTQQELLAEAARTEVENTASLKLLLAMEEETKRKAAIIKKRYQGPLVKYHSKKAADGDVQQTTLQVCNMHYPPPWMRRMRAPPPPLRPHCTVSGLPAKYRDPASGAPYASLSALRRLHARSGAGGGAGGAGAQLGSLTSVGGGGGGGGGSVGEAQLRVVSTRADRRAKGVCADKAAAELAMDDASVLAAAAAGAPSEPLPPALLALLVDVRVAMASGSAQ